MSVITFLSRFAQDSIVINRDEVAIPQGNLEPGTVTTVLQLVFGMAGGVALVIIIVSGIRFVTSQGDPGAVNRARNSVIYAFVGLVVSLLAYSIVTFVLGRIG